MTEKENYKKQKREKEARQKNKKKGNKNSKIFLKRLLIIIAVLSSLIVFSAVGLYFYTPFGKYARAIFKSIPYPVVIVGEKSMITSRQLILNTDAVKNFYESQDFSEKKLRVDFGTVKGKLRLKIKEKDVLNKLVENKIMEELAKKNGIVVTTNEAQEAIDKKISEYGNRKSLELSLESLYGWKMEDFRNNVVIPQTYLRKLFVAYILKTKGQEGYKKCTLAKKELKEDASNFVDVVKKYSEGESAQNNGELGWFRYHQLIPEVADVVFSMKEGETSDVIVSPVGFHVVQVQEIRQQKISQQNSDNSKRKNTEKTIKEMKIRQIYIHGKTFLDWILTQKKETGVIVLMKDYEWDSEKGEIVFRDPNMKKVEKEIRMISQGDPSLGNIQ